MLSLQPLFSPSRPIRSLVDVRYLTAGWQVVILTLSLFRNREVLANYWRLIQRHRGRVAGFGARPQGRTTRFIH